jgi:hypothetical protein
LLSHALLTGYAFIRFLTRRPAHAFVADVIHLGRGHTILTSRELV